MSQKKCTKCGEIKNEDDFPWKKKGMTRRSQCLLCKKEHAANYFKANRDKYIDGLRERRLRVRKELAEHVTSLRRAPCTDCKRTYDPWIMEFDHRDPPEKAFGISRPAGRSKFRAELAKCDLVCANCHKQRTYERRMREKT